MSYRAGSEKLRARILGAVGKEWLCANEIARRLEHSEGWGALYSELRALASEGVIRSKDGDRLIRGRPVVLYSAPLPHKR